MNKQLLKVFGVNGVGLFVRVLSGLLLNKIIALSVGPAGFAVYGQAMNILSLFSTVTVGGVSRGLVGRVSESLSDPDLLRLYVNTTLWVVFFYGLAVVVLFGVCGEFFSELAFYGSGNGYMYLLWIGVSIWFAGMASVPLATMNGMSAGNEWMWVPVWVNVIGGGVGAAACYWGGVDNLVFSILISQAFSVILSYFVYWLKFDMRLFFGGWKFFRLNLAKGVAGFAAMGIVSGVVSNCSQMFLRSLLMTEHGSNVAGIWQGFSKISDVYVSLIGVALTYHFVPVYAKTSSREELDHILVKNSIILFVSMVLFSSVIFYFKVEVIGFVLSASFLEKVDLFGLQLISDVFRVVGIFVALSFWAHGRVFYYVLAELIFGCVVCGCAFLLIDVSGLEGVMEAQIAAYAIYGVVCVGLVRRSRWGAARKF